MGEFRWIDNEMTIYFMRFMHACSQWWFISWFRSDACVHDASIICGGAGPDGGWRGVKIRIFWFQASLPRTTAGARKYGATRENACNARSLAIPLDRKRAYIERAWRMRMLVASGSYCSYELLRHVTCWFHCISLHKILQKQQYFILCCVGNPFLSLRSMIAIE